MCLAIPGRIVSVEETDSDGRIARIDYGIATKSARLLYLPEAGVGDWVIVQAGYATTLLGEEEAREAIECARQMDEALAAAPLSTTSASSSD